jgi:preprotein translocase subunit SecD
VLIFERMREELRNGKTPRSAVEAGYQKALSAILDSNLTTLLAGIVLYQVGTGPIRGFAVTLSLGILTTVFTAVVCTRVVYDLMFMGRGRIQKLYIGIKV